MTGMGVTQDMALVQKEWRMRTRPTTRRQGKGANATKIADKSHTRRFCGMTLQQTEHVSARLADGGHLGDDWQVVDDEADFVLLYLRQVVGVAEDSKARDVGGSVGVVLVHQTRGCNVNEKNNVTITLERSHGTPHKMYKKHCHE